VIQNVSDFIRSEAKIDRSENAARLGGSKIDLHKMIRIEEKSRNLLTLSQSKVKESVSKLIDTAIKFLIGEPLFLKEDGSLFWKFMSRQG
jgi:hypothetical protein